MFVLRIVLTIFALPLGIDASRTKNKYAVSLATQDTNHQLESSTARTEVSVVAGTILRERYVLDSRLYRRDLASKMRDRRSSPRVGHDFPDSSHFGIIPESAEINKFAQDSDGRGPEHLGTGSFGDVWKAYDLHRKQDVAIKFFVTPEDSSDSDNSSSDSRQYLTPSLASQMEDGGMRWFEESIYECQELVDIMEEQAIDTEGSQRICQCLEEHVTDAGDDDPFFLVFEMCGTALSEIFEKRFEQHDAVENSPQWVRNVIKEVLQGIRFLTSMNPAMVHHDLKLENIAVTTDGHVKLIDFGGAMPFEEFMEGGVCSPQYTPPEVMCAQGPSFRYPGRPFEFDVYSTGLMYWELVCNHRPGWEIDDHSESGYQLTSWIPNDRSCQDEEMGIGSQKDIDIIRDMMDENPDRRISPEEAINALSTIIGAKETEGTYTTTVKTQNTLDSTEGDSTSTTTTTATTTTTTATTTTTTTTATTTTTTTITTTTTTTTTSTTTTVTITTITETVEPTPAPTAEAMTSTTQPIEPLPETTSEPIAKPRSSTTQPSSTTPKNAALACQLNVLSFAFVVLWLSAFLM